MMCFQIFCLKQGYLGFMDLAFCLICSVLFLCFSSLRQRFLFGFKVLVVFRTKYLGHISKYWVHFLFPNSGITRLPWDQNYLMDLRIDDDFQFLCFFS